MIVCNWFFLQIVSYLNHGTSLPTPVIHKYSGKDNWYKDKSQTLEENYKNIEEEKGNKNLSAPLNGDQEIRKPEDGASSRLAPSD